MAFPDVALDLDAEILLNGTWTNVSAWMDHGPVSIGRGHPDESTTVSPSTLSGLILTNTDGRFSSKNPLSPYYPYLTRNVPCRISIPSQTPYLRFETDNSSYISTPSSSALNVPGSLEIQVDCQVMFSSASWSVPLLNKWGASGNLAWWLELHTDGYLHFFLSPDGTNGQSVASTLQLPPGRIAVKVTYASATGIVTFYTAASIAGPWTQFGGTAQFAAAGAPFASTAPVQIGTTTAGQSITGNVYAARILNGIGGTVVASPDFTSATPGASSVTDAQGNVWTLAGTAEISGRNYRGHFELADFTQHQSPGGQSVTVDVTGGGLLRRASQRNNPVSSTMYRAWTRVAAAVLAAYWPMEDGTQATRFASASPGGGQAMYFGGGALPQLANNSDFACSNALPVVNGSVFSGVVQYAGTWTDNQVAFLMEVPSGGEINGAAIVAVTTTGTVAKLLLSYDTGGALALQGFDATGTQLFNSGPVGFAVNGQKLLTSVALQNAGGGNITWSMQTLAPGASGASSWTGTISGTIGAVTRVQLNPYSTLGLLGTVFGHCAVLAQWQQLFALDSYQNPNGLWTGALNAWAGEPAGVRFARICSEEGVQFRGRGNLTNTVLMGVQAAQTVQALLQECADADRGVWFETRQCLGWGYIPRSALYNQPPMFTVDYTANHLEGWTADPKEDDQVTVNDVTVTQTTGGSSSRKRAAKGNAITGGRLAADSPPDGIGTYDQSYSLNLASADDLDNEAGWILHIGTTDELRYPGVALDLTNRDLASLFYPILGTDLGDRLIIDDPPAWLSPDPASQLAQQLTETLWYDTLTIVVCGVPELPYEVAVTGSSHVDTDDSFLDTAVSATATSLPVDTLLTTPQLPLWTTSAADFPFDVMIAGERVTVTNITGSSSPQTFTVIRSVNGVVKAQANRAPVSVYPSPVVAL